jgi:hypothetical protein
VGAKGVTRTIQADKSKTLIAPRNRHCETLSPTVSGNELQSFGADGRPFSISPQLRLSERDMTSFQSIEQRVSPDQSGF